MKKMFKDSYDADHSGIPPPELLACRACLATDTKLYTLDGALKEAYEYLMAMPVWQSGTLVSSVCDTSDTTYSISLSVVCGRKYGLPQHICNYCGALLGKYRALKERCDTARRLMEAARDSHYPLTTKIVRAVDRVSHKLLLKFTLGIDTKIIHMVHDDNDIKKCKQQEGKAIDETDGLTDVLNDFDEITNTLNDDDLDLSEDGFEGNGSPFIDRAKSFNVEELFKGKGMNDLNEISNKNIGNDIGDIIRRAFMGKDKESVKKVHSDLDAVKNEDSSSTFRDAEEIIKANLNDNLPADDASINTNDVHDTDSNLVDAFNNFILDHGYLDDKLLLESGDPEFMKKHVISKKTEEDSLLKEIIPNMAAKDKKTLKEKTIVKSHKTKPVKNLSKLKELNRLAQLKKTEVKERKANEINNIKTIKTEDESESFSKLNDETSNSKLIVTKPELPSDTVTSGLSNEFIKFGDDFNFRIFELSLEEQLEELQKRREGALYVGAPYKCVECAKGFHSEETFGNHMRVHDTSYGQFPCAVCGARHKSRARRRRHADTHRLKYCCTQCEFVARSRERAEQHYQWHAGKKYSCHHCGEQFGKVSTQLSHIRLHHPGACVWCALCGEPFVGALGLRQHTRRKHQMIKGEESAELYCNTCRVQFRNAEAFRRHAASGRTHSSLRPCAECGDNFESEAARAQHARRAHVDAAVQCQACPAWFSSAQSRQTHFARAHLRAAPRAPATSATPATPVTSATPAPRRPRPARPAVCELCGNKYHSAAALSYHRRSHTGERPFACPRCPKRFTHNHTLQAHARTHTGERPYRCSQCARAFPTPNNLARHTRTVHLGQRQYSRCAVCRRWLSSPGAARAHARRLHADRL